MSCKMANLKDKLQGQDPGRLRARSLAESSEGGSTGDHLHHLHYCHHLHHPHHLDFCHHLHCHEGVEQNQNRNFVQESKFLFPPKGFQKYGITVTTVRKKVYIFFRNFKVKVKGCSSGFLPDSRNRDASISSDENGAMPLLPSLPSFSSSSWC